MSRSGTPLQTRATNGRPYKCEECPSKRSVPVFLSPVLLLIAGDRGSPLQKCEKRLSERIAAAFLSPVLFCGRPMVAPTLLWLIIHCGGDVVLRQFCAIMKPGDEMENKKDFPTRKKNRLEHYDYSACGAYFITVCTLQRQKLFWENLPVTVGATIGRPQNVTLTQYGKIVQKAIDALSLTYPALSVDSYVIMPNHIHILLRIRADEYGRPMVAPTVSRVVNQFKGFVSKKAEKPIWQKSFFDHVIRNRKDYEEHLKYIDENPIRWYYDELYIEK